MTQTDITPFGLKNKSVFGPPSNSLAQNEITEESGIGQRLRELREAAGLTQSEAAEGLNVALQTISRWELEKRRLKAADYERARAYYSSIIHGNSKRFNDLGQIVPRGTIGEAPAGYSAQGDEDSWSPNPALVNKIPKRAYDVAIAYCTRLRAGGWPREEIEEIERLMIDPRYAQANKRKGVELSVEDHIMLIDATWKAVEHTAAALGRQL